MLEEKDLTSKNYPFAPTAPLNCNLSEVSVPVLSKAHTPTVPTTGILELRAERNYL